MPRVRDLLSTNMLLVFQDHNFEAVISEFSVIPSQLFKKARMTLFSNPRLKRYSLNHLNFVLSVIKENEFPVATGRDRNLNPTLSLTSIITWASVGKPAS